MALQAEGIAVNHKRVERLLRLMGIEAIYRFTVFSFPAAHQRRLRTSNPIERVNMELKRRTRGAGIFPNDASLLRLISALLIEISDQWETEKFVLRPKT